MIKSLETLKNVVSTKAARQILFTKHHSPKILFVVGAVGFVGTVVLAVRATMQMDEILENHEKTLRDNMFTEEKAQEKFEREQKIKTAVKIVRAYTPAIGVGILSIGALAGGQIILTKRNGALMAAYVGLDRAYREYRQRIADEYGVETERKFAIGAEEIAVEEKTADGKIKTTSALAIDSKHERSPYTEVFDERSRFFTKEPGGNANILLMKQNWANDKLRAQGHLYLNEVLDLLGLPRTEAGTVVGWVWRRDNEPKTGDNYVSFGVFDGDPEWVEALLDGVEKYAVLDFNVDGPITPILFGK